MEDRGSNIESKLFDFVLNSSEMSDSEIERFIENRPNPLWNNIINQYFEETTGLTMEMADSFKLEMNELKRSSTDD